MEPKKLDKLSVVVLFLLEKGEIPVDELEEIVAEADMAKISEGDGGEFVADLLEEIRKRKAKK